MAGNPRGGEPAPWLGPRHPPPCAMPCARGPGAFPPTAGQGLWVLVFAGACQGTAWAGSCLIHHHHRKPSGPRKLPPKNQLRSCVCARQEAPSTHKKKRAFCIVLSSFFGLPAPLPQPTRRGGLVVSPLHQLTPLGVGASARRRPPLLCLGLSRAPLAHFPRNRNDERRTRDGPRARRRSPPITAHAARSARHGARTYGGMRSRLSRNARARARNQSRAQCARARSSLGRAASVQPAPPVAS